MSSFWRHSHYHLILPRSPYRMYHSCHSSAHDCSISSKDIPLQQPHLIDRGLRVSNLDLQAVHCRTHILRHKRFHRSNSLAISECDLISSLGGGNRRCRYGAGCEQVDFHRLDLCRSPSFGEDRKLFVELIDRQHPFGGTRCWLVSAVPLA